VLTSRFLQLPTSSHQPSARPGMGSQGCPAAPRGAAKKPTRGFRLYRPRGTVMTTCFRFLSKSHRSAITSHGLE
jgi:hypothetical protein